MFTIVQERKGKEKLSKIILNWAVNNINTKKGFEFIKIIEPKDSRVNQAS